MLPQYFVQTEYNTGIEEVKKVKCILFCSYFLKVISLIFVVLSAIFNMWYMFGFVILYTIGIILRQWVLERIGAYEYFFVNDRLKISKRNNFDKQTLMLDLSIDDIKTIENVERVKNDKNDKNTINAWLKGKSIIKITFIENGCDKYLYFSPSKYMLSLIEKRRNL